MLNQEDAAGLLRDLFAHVPVGDAARIAVLGRLGGEGRHYHGLAHVALLWQRHTRFATDADLTGEEPMRLIASAIAYHDAIYNPKAADNEAQSAALWREDAANALVRTTDMGWVSDTIRATADHFGYLENSCPHEAARIWMLDLDLTPLGEEAEDFARNTALLRLEYAHLSDFAWSSGRARFLEGLQSRPLLFRTPTLARRFEAAARANIAAALEALRRA